ncbi:hypothetical protein MOJ79_07570 [Calidifontimicrobium sp. SYSU G02091]|uniref:hypothetical protein n=1 Tax=Calidifontimicrobium sp. SYSU G02091 TaxID=2926421 RepID=UPI001F53361B|nr:hypothetical protein [Calidifontimicrobium sp. SYSU G02091]MCI1191697.1 hypothetical protein [Calidifontimicrobium sp. SYSU G02091]
MNPWLGWTLAVLAIAIGYVQYGGPGALLGITMVVFWLLLQFSRAMRVMRRAGAAPVGEVGSAVMLHAKLHAGMRLLDILPLAGALGRKVADAPETFEWRDASGARVRVEFERGRCVRWTLSRPDDVPDDGGGRAADGAPGATPPGA